MSIKTDLALHRATSIEELEGPLVSSFEVQLSNIFSNYIKQSDAWWCCTEVPSHVLLIFRYKLNKTKGLEISKYYTRKRMFKRDMCFPDEICLKDKNGTEFKYRNNKLLLEAVTYKYNPDIYTEYTKYIKDVKEYREYMNRYEKMVNIIETIGGVDEEGVPDLNKALKYLSDHMVLEMETMFNLDYEYQAVYYSKVEEKSYEAKLTEEEFVLSKKKYGLSKTQIIVAIIVAIITVGMALITFINSFTYWW